MKRKVNDVGDSEDVDEDEKVSKKLKAEDSEEEIDDNEESLFDADFDIKKFRQNLKAGNFYDDLKLFIKQASKNADIIRAFADSGIKALEIAEVIKNNEESNLEVISNLYNVLRSLISHIKNDDNQRLDPTVQALKFLISIGKMLSSSKTSDKVLMLKILSIATSLDTEIGRDILKNIDIFGKSSEKDDFSIFEDKKSKKVAYEESVRLAFVHFILGFLLHEKDVILRKKILQKRSLFEFFLRDLYKDNYETIKSVITCLTKNVLISQAFSKPEKLKIFTDNAIKSILKLYMWKSDDDSEKSSVLNITHQFLLLLLTSKKHGIVFKALSEKRQNLRQLQVLNLFKNVWNNEYPSMLMIEIIKSCPDLMQNLLNRLVMGLQPQVSTNWFMCVNFTTELIKVMEPSLMINSFAMLEPKKISSNIIKLSISQFILQNVSETALIQIGNVEMREASLKLLHVMLDRCCKYLNEVKKIQTLKDFEKHRIKFDIINHIFTFYPHIDIILNSLYRSINFSTKQTSDENVGKLVKSQLKHTLEILLLIIKYFPSIIEKIPNVINFLEVLRPIYEYQLSASADVDKNEDLEIEMKVVKVILSLQPSILAIESEMFQRIFLVLIQVYCFSSNDEFRKESKILLSGILHNSMILNTESSLELNVWLETFKCVKKGILKESATTFVKVLRSLKNSENENLKWEHQEVMICDFELLKMIDDEEEADESDTSEELSLILPALLNMKSSKTNRIIDFIEIAFVLLYHSYPQYRKSFMKLLEDKQNEINTQILSYIRKQSLKDFGGTLEAYTELVYRKFQLAIINDEFVEMNDVKDIQELEMLIIQSIFCAFKLEKSGKLTNEKVQLLTNYIQKFFTNIMESEKNDSNLIFSMDIFEKIQPEDIEKKANKISDLTMAQPSVNLVKHIFKHQTMLLNKFTISQPDQLTIFIGELSEIMKSTNEFETSSKGYRIKIVSELKEMLSTESLIKDEVFDIIEKFSLDDVNCVDILSVLLMKKMKNIKEMHVKLVTILMRRLTCLKTLPLTKKVIEKLEVFYIEAASNTAIDLSALEDTLLDYFTEFCHNIGDLSVNMFKLAFREDQTATKSFVKLFKMIFTRNHHWNKIFIKDVMKMKKELMYPLLSVALKKELMKVDQCKPIYQEFKSGIIKAIEKPNKAAQIYRENILTSLKLIELSMPLNECQDLAMKKFKFDASEVYQVKMLHGIFTKAFKANNDGKIFINFINHWLNLFVLSLNNNSGINEEYLEVLSDWMKIIKPLPSNLPDVDVNMKTWETFIKMCLKHGLKSCEGSKMLMLLGQVIRSINVTADEVTTIFDMILTHSNFFNVVFNFKVSGRVLKTNLFFLLNVLVQRNPSVAHEKHIPILLSAYQATMSSSDQLILNLLRFYELRCGIDFFDFRPFLFGPTALSHFTSNDEQEMMLMKKTVDDMNGMFVKVLDLFEKSMIESTLNKFPIKRKLAGVPSDELEGILKEEVDDCDAVYDPGYFLPLFEMILSSSNFIFISSAKKNNLMSLIFPALSCEDENMRLLAAHILLKCRECNENKKGTKELWIRFYDSIQQGFSEIQEGTGNDDKAKEKHFPRAASISTQLLSEFVNILPNSLHNAYNIASNYFVVREKFEFNRIPELFVMFYSYDVHQEEHRMFLLNAIYNGIKDDLDVKLINNTPLIKILLSCSRCSLSNRKIDLMILKIFDRIVTKTSKTAFLLQKFGLGVWLFEVAVKVEAFEYEMIEAILNLINNCVKTMSMKDKVNFCRLFISLLCMLPKFTKSKLSAEGFLNFLKVMNIKGNFKHEVTKEHHEMIKALFEVFLSEQQMKFINYLDNRPESCSFLESSDDYCKSFSTELDSNTKSILLEGRQYLINYHKN
ncbi:CLUMA_CG008402, isoform A [Clunio marinus]|uniref:CLUMA_CG008402, isoform A n=1 Tax=Clunio marinus TaxID=568069 RepID=A0A1J1I7I2_9DIPT|nr:CLUMA_CG008402, isoform A [Clunio marinus]